MGLIPPINSDATRRFVMALAPLAFAVGIAHLGYQIAKHWDLVTLDFRFFWLAGEFWTHGSSPYDASFAAEAAAQFGVTTGAIWYYTPNWFPIAAIFSLVEPLAASRAWSLFNAGLLIGASALNVAAFRSLFARSSLLNRSAPIAALVAGLGNRTLFMGHAGFMASAQAAGNTLHLGQSSMLIYCGASLLVFAAARGRLVCGAAALAVLMLKPQIGLIVVAALVFSIYGRRVIFLAAPVSLAMAAPAFAVASPAAMIGDMLAGLTQYNAQSYNLPGAMTGFRHLVWAVSGGDPGTGASLLVAVSFIGGIGAAAALHKRAIAPAEMALLVLAAALFFAPLHVYDFVMAGALALPAVCLSTAPAICAVAFAVLWRAGNLPQATPIAHPEIVFYPGSLYASLAAFTFLLAITASGKNAYLRRSGKKLRDAGTIRRPDPLTIDGAEA